MGYFLVLDKLHCTLDNGSKLILRINNKKITRIFKRKKENKAERKTQKVKKNWQTH